VPRKSSGKRGCGRKSNHYEA
jgi:hypothetical protein